MLNRKLYQKQHGCPGVPLSSGKDGADGSTGNNVYFGYIYEFFNNTEFEVDNLVRLASSEPHSDGTVDKYYTGVWGSGPDNDYICQDVIYPYEEGNILDSSNIFKSLSDVIIYDPSRGKMTYDEYFSGSYSSGNSESKVYVKVDMNPKGWNNPSSNLDPSLIWETSRVIEGTSL